MDGKGQGPTTLSAQLKARRWATRPWRRARRGRVVFPGVGGALGNRLRALRTFGSAGGPTRLRVASVPLHLLRRARTSYSFVCRIGAPIISVALSARFPVRLIRRTDLLPLRQPAPSGTAQFPAMERPPWDAPAAGAPAAAPRTPIGPRWGRTGQRILRETIRDFVMRERVTVTRFLGRRGVTPPRSPVAGPLSERWERPARDVHAALTLGRKGVSLDPVQPGRMLPPLVLRILSPGALPASRGAPIVVHPGTGIALPLATSRILPDVAAVRRSRPESRAEPSQATPASARGRVPELRYPAGRVLRSLPARGPAAPDDTTPRFPRPPTQAMPLASYHRASTETVTTEKLRRELTSTVMKRVHTVVEKEVRNCMRFDSRDARRLREQMYSELGSQLVFERERLGRS